MCGAEDMTLLVRARSEDAEGLRTAVTAAVNDAATEAPFRLMSMQGMVDGVVWLFRAFFVTASLLGVVGLVFAYSGTHAVVSFLVAQRMREFGIRMALGASASRIVLEMVKHTSRTALLGLAAGLAVAAGLVRLLTASAPGPRPPFVVGAAIAPVATWWPRWCHCVAARRSGARPSIQ
jgi:ABC-type antimicrobial peptide transport system permease subunit